MDRPSLMDHPQERIGRDYQTTSNQIIGDNLHVGPHAYPLSLSLSLMHTHAQAHTHSIHVPKKGE